MFEYFPGNYVWNLGVVATLTSTTGTRWSRLHVFFCARTARSIYLWSCCLVFRNTVSSTILPSAVHQQVILAATSRSRIRSSHTGPSR